MKAMQDAVASGNYDDAALLAQSLYKSSNANGNDKEAGELAYYQGQIEQFRNEHLGASDFFKTCSTHYDKIDAQAQSVKCQYYAGEALFAAGKRGQSVSQLRKAEKMLREMGEENSAFAAILYISLSEKIRPSKVERGFRIDEARKDAIQYADKALYALDENELQSSQQYVSALLAKGLAQEEAGYFDDAYVTYNDALETYRTLPKRDKATEENIRTRLFVVRPRDKSEKNKLTVETENGEEVVLNVVKRRRVVFPKIGDNQLVDGAKVYADIWLHSDGRVKDIEITESYPSEEFGEAFEKGVSTWSFTTDEDIDLESLSPIQYGMVFYVQNRE